MEIECQRLKKALASLERSYHIMLEVLGEALGLKTNEIEGPSKRVTVFTICIARAMGLSREHINPMARGAVFHDVGKMAIPDRILRKPGLLRPDETLSCARTASAVMSWCTKFHFLPTLPRLFTPITNGTTALVIPVDFPADKYPSEQGLCL
jgi:hypothetical protein